MKMNKAEQIANLDYGSVVTIADDIIQFLQKLDLCAKTGFWYDEFQDRQMNSEGFDWLFVKVAGCLATYIYGWGQGKEKQFIYPIGRHKPLDFPSAPNITIDGKTVHAVFKGCFN